jgi:hypothetical protein
MAPPRFESIAATAVDIEGTVSSWSLLREYTAALKLLADQDWIRCVTEVAVTETVVAETCSAVIFADVKRCSMFKLFCLKQYSRMVVNLRQV